MEDMRRILVAREPLYSKADVAVDTTGRPPEECLMQLRQALAA
jgi:XRE family aerobic/anaerobic benzoate catabolism transcriptional regulator